MTSKQFIDSGILEQYVFGTASPADMEEVERMAAADPIIRSEIDAICETLEIQAMANAIEPGPGVKLFLMAEINYTERLKNGEPVTTPPLLHEQSIPADYAGWLNRDDMQYTGTENLFAKIIGYTPEVITAIIWIKTITPLEIHDDEYKRFLIVEGTCNILVGDDTSHLVPGDYFAIPLYKNHVVKVTSAIPCKIILQRVAA